MTDTVYTWGIANLEVAPEDGELTDVVRTVHWTLTAEADDGLTASSYGSIGLAEPDAESFIAFNALTAVEVEGWLEDKLDASAIRDGLAANIEAQRNPPIVSKPAPWVE